MLHKCVFDDFVRLNRGFDLPDSDIIPGDFPVVASTNIKSYHNEYKVEPPVVVTGRSGSLGKVQYITHKCWPLNTALYSKDLRGNDARYVYYYLQTMHLEQYNVGVGVPTLNQNHLQRLKIYIHSKDEQKQIADILSAYDNLIEVNNKRIKVLEQMAENLYKEWFVRFRFPGYETAEFCESRIGRIPACFKVIKNKDAFEYYIGGGWGNDDEDKEFPISAYVIRGTDFPRVAKGDVSTCPLRFHKKSNYSARELKAQDIIIEVSGGTSEQPVGRTLMVTQDVIDRLVGRVICASFCKQVRVDKAVISPLYYNYWMKFLYDTRIIDRFQLQSTGIINFQFEFFLNKGDVMLPPMELMRRFDALVLPILDQISTIAKENENLIKQRDLVLPRLMSGKLEV